MAEYGLYTVDATEELNLQGYANNLSSWKRTKLKYNGVQVCSTAEETNYLGIYASGDKLKLNGTEISIARHQPECISKQNSVSFGDTILGSTQICTNITLSNYNKLRSGQLIPGYTKYDSHTIYNITNNASGATVTHAPVDLEDPIYNSLVGNLSENQLTDATYLEPNYTPSLVVEPFYSIIKPGAGLSFKYFVDTADYDSIYKNQIGDTFTTIVEDSFGNILYKKTTYAGEFDCTLLPFKDGKNSQTNLTGRTYFSVRCIDNHGRGSYERFFTVLIDNVQPNIYNVTPEILTSYGITPNSDYTDCVSGHKNKQGFQRLFNDVKQQGYTGIKLYNQCNSQDLNDADNTVYMIDNHHVLRAEQSNPLTSESQLSHYTAYYLVEYKDGKITGISKEPAQYTKSDFDQFKIAPGRVITIGNKSWTIGQDVDPFNYIRHDKAKIYRDEDDKIVVHWEHDLEPNEIAVAWNSKVWTNGALAQTRVLRVKSLNRTLMKAVAGEDLSAIFQEGNGYYYMTLLAGQHYSIDGGDRYNYDYMKDGSNVYALIDNPIIFPDNFTVDFNYTTWRCTDSTDLYQKNKLISINANINVHIKNCRVIGPFDSDNVKDAFLKCCRVKTGPWEGNSCVSLAGAEFCSFDNVEVSNSGGYETVMGPTSTSLNITGFSRNNKSATAEGNDRVRFQILGYLKNGSINTNAVIKDNGKSLLPDQPFQYTYTSNNQTYYYPIDYNHYDGATDVCLVSTNGFTPIDFYVHYNLGNTNKDSDAYYWGFYINSTCFAPTKAWHGGKCHEFFIEFYDQNNQFIRSVKTKQHLVIIPPAEAKKFKATGYGLCNTTNNTYLVTKDGLERSLADITFFVSPYTQNCTFNNYKVHHTRTIALCGTALNVKFENCRFNNIANAPGRLAVTKMFMDIEENCLMGHGLAFHNCVCVGDQLHGQLGFQVPQTLISGTPTEVVMKNCTGLGLGGCMSDCILMDNTMSILRIELEQGLGSKFNNIIKRTKVCYDFQSSRPTQSNKKKVVGTGSSYKVRNTCDTKVTDKVSLDNCFTVKETTVAIVGRESRIKNEIQKL